MAAVPNKFTILHIITYNQPFCVRFCPILINQCMQFPHSASQSQTPFVSPLLETDSHLTTINQLRKMKVDDYRLF